MLKVIKREEYKQSAAYADKDCSKIAALLLGESGRSVKHSLIFAVINFVDCCSCNICSMNFPQTQVTRALSYHDMASAQYARVKREDMITERLHYFYSGIGTQGQRCSFSRNENSSAGMVDELCPSSQEQRASACTEVFEVWNTEAWRRQIGRSASSSRDGHNPRLRSLSTSLASFSYLSSVEGSTSGRALDQAGELNALPRSSPSSRAHVVIRITPSNSSGSLGNLSDLPSSYVSEESEASTEDCALSLPSSGCVIGGGDASSSADSNGWMPPATQELLIGHSSATNSDGDGILVPFDGSSSISHPPSQVKGAKDEQTLGCEIEPKQRTDDRKDPKAEPAVEENVHREQRGAFQMCRRLAHSLKMAYRRKRLNAK